MSTRSVIIRRFALGPLAQWGLVTGIVVACVPAFLCSWLLFTLLASLRSLISGWRDVGLEILGQRISFNLVEALRLQEVLNNLSSITGLGVFGIVLFTIGLALVLGIFGALVLTTLGIFYNMTGRLRLELEELDQAMGDQVRSL